MRRSRRLTNRASMAWRSTRATPTPRSARPATANTRFLVPPTPAPGSRRPTSRRRSARPATPRWRWPASTGSERPVPTLHRQLSRAGHPGRLASGRQLRQLPQRARHQAGSSDPTSSVNKANLGVTCGSCHPGANERFAVGSVHISLTAQQEPLLYWVATVYIILIVVLIGGMLAAQPARFRPEVEAEC